MKIALDAMGGDFGPLNLVAGAVMALRDYPHIEKLFLVGDTVVVSAVVNNNTDQSTKVDVSLEVVVDPDKRGGTTVIARPLRFTDGSPTKTTVTVEANGKMFLGKEEVNLASLQEKVVALRVDDPDLSIVIRGSGHAKYRGIVGVMDMLQQANVTKVNLATEPFPDGKALKQ